MRVERLGREPVSPRAVSPTRDWLLFFLAVSLLFAARDARAIAKFSIGPPRFELKLDAGSETTLLIDVVNHGDEDLRLKAYATDFDLDEDGQPTYPGGARSAHSCTGWFRFNPQTLKLGVAGTDGVRATARVPKDAAGTFWCALFLEDVPLPKRAEKKALYGIEMKARIGALVYVDVGPLPARSVRAEKLSSVANPETGKVDSIAELVHDGGGYTRVTGTWELVSAEGKVIATSPVNAPLLPGHRERFRWSADAAAGSYTVRLNLDFGGPKHLVVETVVTVPAKRTD